MTVTNVICTRPDQVRSVMYYYHEDVTEHFSTEYDSWLDNPCPCTVTYGGEELDLYSKPTMLELIREFRKDWPSEKRITYAEWEELIQRHTE